MKKYNATNFNKSTFCKFLKTNKILNRIPDFISSYNSEYFFEDNGIYRRSNHWGRAGKCRWLIINNEEKPQTIVTGFALWTDFFENHETKPLFFITETKPFLIEYQHRDHKDFNNQILRSAQETASRIKSLKEVISKPNWLKYLDEDIKKVQRWLIDELITTNTPLTELRRSYIKKAIL